jgi:hypothetical protein
MDSEVFHSLTFHEALKALVSVDPAKVGLQPNPTVVDKKVLPLEDKGSGHGRDWDNDNSSETMGGWTEQLRAADRRALCPDGTAPAGAGLSPRLIESART